MVSTPIQGVADEPPGPEANGVPCYAHLWRHACYWYLVEAHDCAWGHGWKLISHHRCKADAQAAADARYPRPHQ